MSSLLLPVVCGRRICEVVCHLLQEKNPHYRGFFSGKKSVSSDWLIAQRSGRLWSFLCFLHFFLWSAACPHFWRACSRYAYITRAHVWCKLICSHVNVSILIFLFSSACVSCSISGLLAKKQTAAIRSAEQGGLKCKTVVLLGIKKKIEVKPGRVWAMPHTEQLSRALGAKSGQNIVFFCCCPESQNLSSAKIFILSMCVCPRLMLDRKSVV